MKNIILVNPKYRFRIYFYSLAIFIFWYIICLIYVIHENRYYVATEIKPVIFVYDRKSLDYYDADITNIKFNLVTDNSITKFVNNNISFNDISYVPIDLEKISWDNIIDLKWISELRSDANKALQNMANDFFQTFWEKMVVVSAYRSYGYQKNLKANWCSDQFCAKPGYSEHQTWLAVDLWEASSEKSFLSNKKYTEYFEWMKENAYKYGFHNTYQKWLEVDWYVVEPWHWRYLGIDLAKNLYENKLTLAEYNKNLK